MPPVENVNQDSVEAVVVNNEEQDEKNLTSPNQEESVVEKVKNKQSDSTQARSTKTNPVIQVVDVFKNRTGIGLGKSTQVETVERTQKKSITWEDVWMPRLWKSALLLFLFLCISLFIVFKISTVAVDVGVAAVLILVTIFSFLIALIAFFCRSETPMAKFRDEKGEVSTTNKALLWFGYFFASIGLSILGVLLLWLVLIALFNL
ncbi:MAG: hypothetical protein ACRCYO_16935 [Bacteroidia bacterium]